MTCNFPTCTAIAPHDMHLLAEPGSPYPMRVAADRRAVYLWLPDGTLLKQPQPDAVRKLRARVRELAAGDPRDRRTAEAGQ